MKRFNRYKPISSERILSLPYFSGKTHRYLFDIPTPRRHLFALLSLTYTSIRRGIHLPVIHQMHKGPFPPLGSAACCKIVHLQKGLAGSTRRYRSDLQSGPGLPEADTERISSRPGVPMLPIRIEGPSTDRSWLPAAREARSQTRSFRQQP